MIFELVSVYVNLNEHFCANSKFLDAQTDSQQERQKAPDCGISIAT